LQHGQIERPHARTEKDQNPKQKPKKSEGAEKEKITAFNQIGNPNMNSNS
jgi:hypothetical protein